MVALKHNQPGLVEAVLTVETTSRQSFVPTFDFLRRRTLRILLPALPDDDDPAARRHPLPAPLAVGTASAAVDSSRTPSDIQLASKQAPASALSRHAGPYDLGVNRLPPPFRPLNCNAAALVNCR
ncbi:hypothetical protein F503_06979 [Ophiostoma piceae UAMH 11346]|uniref:Uncharacterized protein n=1 Tax=Ophiostoma piceae (strain UAMH 11346) TaxID=1262450 RepID=S3CRH9_OPHP1|nr:hypothetical protein F503_06979 [Ophiostoma piceae UAMH 11346]